MFYIFQNQNERRDLGGTVFLEIQYCKMKRSAKLKDIVAVDNIKNWQNDSLYVPFDDINDFLDCYGDIFNCGVYNNLNEGIVDIYGVNYYSLEKVYEIKNSLKVKKPVDYQIILEWLEKAS